MTSSSGRRPPSDRTLRIVLRVGVAVLVLGLAGFGAFYYLGQRVEPGPSLASRQVTAAERAVRTAPGDLAARLALAQAYESARRVDDAIAQYDEILRAVPAHRTALLGRAGLLLAKGDLAGAKAGYTAVTKAQSGGEFAGADPQLEEAHYYLAVIALRRGDDPEAVAQARAALKIEPTDSDAWYTLGSAQLSAGRAQEAVTSLQQALRFVPSGWCDPYAQLAIAYGNLHQQPRADYSKAMVSLCRKDYPAARSGFLALTTGPAAPDALVGLGSVAESTGRTAEAVDWYRKALAVEPTSTGAMAGLSRLGVGPSSAPAVTSTGEQG